MGIYGDHVLPRIVNAVCAQKVNGPQRQRVCERLEGEVVEIGFGSGLNIPFYPASVTRVAAVEPADLGWKLAEKRLRATSVPVERSGLDGQSLPFEDNSFDTALSAWTLCTIPDLGAGLSELRRVLKPGGTLHFVEHGLAPDEGVRRWPSARARPEAGLRRLPPHPADRRSAHERRLHDRRRRRLLRGRRPQGPGANSLGSAVSP